MLILQENFSLRDLKPNEQTRGNSLMFFVRKTKLLILLKGIRDERWIEYFVYRLTYHNVVGYCFSTGWIKCSWKILHSEIKNSTGLSVMDIALAYIFLSLSAYHHLKNEFSKIHCLHVYIRMPGRYTAKHHSWLDM